MAKSASPYRKLLEQWQPPDHAGKPIGCLTTTFTFSTAFFEEQCLARFLNIDSDPNTDAQLYLIEREEKMAGLSGAVVIADSLHCNEARSLRWDVIAARVAGGIQHAKVSLLVWQHHVRLIIASANMTEDGYCKNQEVFGVLDYASDSIASRSALDDSLDFLTRLPALVNSAVDSSSVTRWQSVIEHARTTCDKWSATDEENAEISLYPFFITPDAPNLFEQINAIWPQGGISHAYAASPFFDVDEKYAKSTVKAFIDMLNSRGVERTVGWFTTAEQSPDEGWWMHLPKACRTTPERKGIKTEFYRVKQRIVEDEVEHFRPLHAKMLWFANQRWCAYVCGSSNFTQRGLGLSGRPNIEANLVYVFRKDNKKLYKAFNQSWINHQYVKPNELLFGDIQQDEAELEALNQSSLPLGFVDASIKRHQSEIQLVLTLDKPPASWSISDHNRDELVASSDYWKEDGSPRSWPVTWSQLELPTLLKVNWDDGFAYWPVNIADMSLLPPPDELRNLSLDSLIEILSSQGSLRDVMRRILRRQQHKTSSNGHAMAEELDPHKRVQTSHHLIPRTRRISQVLSGLQNRLERPVVTLEALHWRLYGPIGVNAVVNALETHAESHDEFAFLLSELMLVLRRIRYEAHEGVLSETDFTKSMQQVLTELSSKLLQVRKATSPMIAGYCEKVNRECNSAGGQVTGQ